MPWLPGQSQAAIQDSGYCLGQASQALSSTGNSNSQHGRPGCSFETAGAYSDCPPPWTLLPAAAVPLGLDQADINRYWSHHKEGILTIHKTQLVIDKTQDHIHNRAKLWREGAQEVRSWGGTFAPAWW